MKVLIIGNGNFGTTISKVLGESNNVTLWVHEEKYDNMNLSDWIRDKNLNPKYLPGVDLPKMNVITDFDATGYDVVIFCIPHQFLDSIKKFTFSSGSKFLNLSKGLILENQRLMMPAEKISQIIGHKVSTLNGPNIANEIANNMICETTIGVHDDNEGSTYLKLFSAMNPEITTYNAGIELFSGMKNIISIGYGVSTCFGHNFQSIIFRRGILEIKRACEILGFEFPLLKSCGIGDLLVSSICGRNYKFGVELSKKCTIEAFEKQMNDQKLQGPDAAKMFYDWLKINNHDLNDFPISVTVYKICFEGANMNEMKKVLNKQI